MALDPISAIVQGLGGITQGVGAVAASRANVDCGSRPLIATKKNKERRDAYDACMLKSQDLKQQALNVANQTPSTTTDGNKSVKIIAGIVISAIVVIVIVVVVKKSRENK